MGADPVIYCLEHLTDYDQFERLCHDIMALDGYRGIEPVGGTKDKGRDALHLDRSTGTTTVFAYSVREDWRTKLETDAAKVRGHGHECGRFAFLSTATFSPSERDDAVAFIRTTYGWELVLYGLERLANMLRSSHKEVIAQHPHIFCPPFFPAGGGLSFSDSHDHVLIDHVDADAGLAHWLSRRLTLSGFSVWCRGLAPLAGASVNDTIRRLLESRAFRYVSILSPASVNQPDFASRRSAAHAVGSHRGTPLVVPALARQIDASYVEDETRRLAFARFDESWGTGLRQVEEVLASAGCPRRRDGACELALRSYFPTALVSSEPETVYSNLFRVTKVPQAILRFGCNKAVDEDKVAARWAFRKTRETEFLSFERPPPELVDELGISELGGDLWARTPKVDGVPMEHLLKELIRKTLYTECRRRGLQYCEQRKLTYFPFGLLKNDTLRLTQPDGSPSSFAVAGERSYGKAERGNKYRYHIAPVFVPRGEPQSGFDVIVRIRIRITDVSGQLYPGHGSNARRKKLCKSWWNQEWFNRLVGVMQFLAADQDEIAISANAGECLVIDKLPRTWVSPVRLNEEALLESGPALEEDELHAFAEDEEDEEYAPAAGEPKE
jgi:hypothetical protein